MRALWISELHPEGWLRGLRLCGVLHEQAGGKAPISVEARPRREHLCASKPDVPVIDVDSSDEQSLEEAAAEEAPAEETPAEKASAEEAGGSWKSSC